MRKSKPLISQSNPQNKFDIHQNHLQTEKLSQVLHRGPIKWMAIVASRCSANLHPPRCRRRSHFPGRAVNYNLPAAIKPIGNVSKAHAVSLYIHVHVVTQCLCAFHWHVCTKDVIYTTVGFRVLTTWRIPKHWAKTMSTRA